MWRHNTGRDTFIFIVSLFSMIALHRSVLIVIPWIFFPCKYFWSIGFNIDWFFSSWYPHSEYCLNILFDKRLNGRHVVNPLSSSNKHQQKTYHMIWLVLFLLPHLQADIHVYIKRINNQLTFFFTARQVKCDIPYCVSACCYYCYCHVCFIKKNISGACLLSQKRDSSCQAVHAIDPSLISMIIFFCQKKCTRTKQNIEKEGD